MRLKCRLHTVDDTIRARHEFISALIQDFKRTQRVSQSPIIYKLGVCETPEPGITPIRSGLLLEEGSITSRRIPDITQLITVVLADKIGHHEYLRSLKALIA